MFQELTQSLRKTQDHFKNPASPWCKNQEVQRVSISGSVVPNSLRPHGLQPTRLLCAWDFPGKDPGVGCHFHPQGTFPTQGSKLGLPYCGQILYQLSYKGSPQKKKKKTSKTRKRHYYKKKQKTIDQYMNIITKILSSVFKNQCNPHTNKLKKHIFTRSYQSTQKKIIW